MVRALAHSLFLCVCAVGLLRCGPPQGGTAAYRSTPSGSSGGSCLKLTLPPDGLTAAPPAKVALSFTVDTCDGQPVSGLTAENFELLEDDAPVSSFESQRSLEAKSQKFRTYSMVLLDLSGSILRSGSFNALKDAALLYVDRVLATQGESQRIALYTFDGRAAVVPLVEFTNDATALRNGILSLSKPECETSAQCAAFPDRKTCAGWLCVDDSTNLNGALVQGLERLDRELRVDPTIQYKDGALVLFTDGRDQAGRVQTSEVSSKLSLSKSHVFTIGLGGESDEKSLKAFGKDGYQPAADAGQLSAAFDAIASKVVGLANRFYLLQYCSPKRAGSHALKLNATWMSPDKGKLTGSLSTRFDATGFGSGCALQ